MNLIQMSVAAGILILGIVLFRSLLVHRLPKIIMVILWEIAILRLLLPFSIPLPLPEPFAELRSLTVTESKFELVTGTFDADENWTKIEVSENGVDALARALQPGWTAMVLIVYLAGAAVMLSLSLFLYMRDSQLFREGLPMREGEKKKLLALAGMGEKDLRRFGKIKFQISDRTATPVTYGVIRPAVVFPKGMYLKDEKEVSLCLRHELVHIRNHDNLKKLIAHITLCIHWFNPLVWVMYLLFNRDMELLCDETVVRRSGESRQDYALTLLSLAECRSRGFQMGLGFGKNAVKERIVAVMTFKKTTLIGVLAAVIAVTGALTVFVTNSVNRGQDEAAMETVVVAEYDSTSVEDTGTLNVAWLEQGSEVSVTTDYPLEENTYLITVVQMEDTAEAAGYTGDKLYTYTQEVSEAAAVESGDLSEGMRETIENLAAEFMEYGLSVEFSGDDYQLYYEGEPIYFFADNKKQIEDGFSGRLFARSADGENGYTGVITKYDASGNITGLVHLSEEESRAYYRKTCG